MHIDDDLNALLTSALIEQTPAKKRAQVSEDRHRASFYKPESWTKIGQVQLVHKGYQVNTLLGLFDEFHHFSAKDARRLVATKEITGEARIEYVSGDSWVGKGIYARGTTPERTMALSLPIELGLGQVLHASLPCFVTAHLTHGGLTFLTLDGNVTFHGSTPREILSLPQGMNILEGLTHECRQRVWAAVQIEIESSDASPA